MSLLRKGAFTLNPCGPFEFEPLTAPPDSDSANTPTKSVARAFATPVQFLQFMTLIILRFFGSLKKKFRQRAHFDSSTSRNYNFMIKMMFLTYAIYHRGFSIFCSFAVAFGCTSYLLIFFTEKHCKN
jgi:hypothetical protein